MTDKPAAPQPDRLAAQPQCNGLHGDEEACPVHGAEIRAARGRNAAAPPPLAAFRALADELDAEADEAFRYTQEVNIRLRKGETMTVQASSEMQPDLRKDAAKRIRALLDAEEKLSKPKDQVEK